MKVLLLQVKSILLILFVFNSYAGFTGGSHYGHKGAAVEPLCLPRHPEWGVYNDGLDGTKSYVYGAEYKTGSFRGYIKTVDSHDVPCALCLVRHRSVVQMFPGICSSLVWDWDCHVAQSHSVYSIVIPFLMQPFKGTKTQFELIFFTKFIN